MTMLVLIYVSKMESDLRNALRGIGVCVGHRSNLTALYGSMCKEGHLWLCEMNAAKAVEKACRRRFRWIIKGHETNYPDYAPTTEWTFYYSVADIYEQCSNNWLSEPQWLPAEESHLTQEDLWRQLCLLEIQSSWGCLHLPPTTQMMDYVDALTK